MWRFEHRTFYIISLRAKLILACTEVSFGQIKCGGAMMSLAPNKPKKVALSFKLKHCLRACTTSGESIIDFVCKTTGGKS